jgi:serine protease AprX
MKDSFLTKISYFLLILVLLSVFVSSINNSADVNFTDVNSTKINLTKNITNISFEKNFSNSSFNISINTTKNTSFDNLSINSSNNITNKTINVSNINNTEKNISTLNISANTTVISYVDIILTFNHDENNKNKNINSIKSEYFVQERNLSKEIKTNNKKLKNVENNNKFSVTSNEIKKINNNVKNKILKKDELHEQKVQEIKDAVNLDLSDLKNDFLADYPEIELKKFDSGTNSLVVKVPEDRLNDIVNDYRIKNFDYDKNNFKLLLDVAIPSIVSSDWWPIASHSSGLSDVAIVDSGVNSNHNALKNVYDGSSRDFVWHDFTYDSGDRETPREYGNYHGSHCAGIVASNDEVYGLFDGVAPGLKKIINAKIFYQDSQNRDAIGISSSYIYDAFNWSITNTSTTAEVLSNSWGCGADTCEDFISLCADTTNGSDPTTVKIDYYSDLYDVLMVNAAGNSGDCRDNTTLGVPADAYNTITVGAINYSSTINRSDDFIAYYSARGPTVDNRKKPDVVAPGINITAPSSDIYQEWDNNTFVISGGTSMAAPMVSGIAAILFNEGLSALEVKSVIINSAEDINETSWDIYSGWGYVNLTTAYAIKDYSLIEQIPANSTKFYLITNMSEGDKVTLVWNRHANVSSYGVNKLNNLNLELFDACTGNLLNYSNSSVDNVEQTIFNSDCNKSIVKVKSNETFISEDNETFSLSLYSDSQSLGLMNQHNPNISLNISVPEPIENKTNFQVNISLKNNNVIDYFDSNLTLNIPVSLDNLTASFFEISRINSSEELNFSVNLSSLSNITHLINASFVSVSYEQRFNKTTNNVEIDTLFPEIFNVYLSKNIFKENDLLFVNFNYTEVNVENISVRLGEFVNISPSCSNNFCEANYSVKGTESPLVMNLTINISDSYGQYSINKSLIKFDFTSPVINNVSLSSDVVQYGLSRDVIVNASDDQNLTAVVVEGNNLSLVDGLWSGRVNLYEPPLDVIIYDEAGNNATNNSLTFNIDNIAPNSSLTTFVGSDNISTNNWLNSSVNVTFLAHDNFNVSMIQYKFGVLCAWNDLDYPQSNNLTIDSKLNDNRLYFRAVDEAGNTELYNSQIIKIDKVAPVLNHFELNEEYVNNMSTLHLSGSASDNFSGVDYVQAELNDTNSTKFNLTYNSNSNLYEKDFVVPTNKNKYSLNISVYDAAGNVIYDLLNFTVGDESSYILSNIYNGSYVMNNSFVNFSLINVSNNSFVNVSGIGRINLSDDQEILNVNIKNYQDFYVNFSVYDFQNNFLFNKTYNFIIDFTGPVVSINNILDEQFINGTYVINYSVVDAEQTIDYVNIYLNDSFIANISDLNNSYSFDSFIYDDDSYILKINAYDVAGNLGTDNKTININNNITLIEEVNELTGLVDLSNSSFRDYLSFIMGLNSTNASIKMSVNNSLSAASLPDFLQKLFLYFDIIASTPNESKIYFSLDPSFLSGVDLDYVYVWSNHDSNSFTNPQDITYVDTYEGKYRFYFNTTSYSEFMIGARYPDCVVGEEITSDCVCDDSIYDSGYCCSGGYSSNDCSYEEESSNTGGTNLQTYSCVPEYNCTAWEPSECTVLRIQSRSCIDVNECGYDLNKPAETRTCEYVPDSNIDANDTVIINDSIFNNISTNDTSNNETSNYTSIDTVKEEIKINSSKLIVLIILIVLFLVCVFLVYSNTHPKSIIRGASSLHKDRDNYKSQLKFRNNLIRYVEECIAAGKEFEEIKQNLINAGWNDELVDEIFSIVASSNK